MHDATARELRRRPLVHRRRRGPTARSTRAPARRSSGSRPQGLDLGEMTTYARTVGGPALRALTFHERAGMLKALGKQLMAHIDEFHALSLPHRRHQGRRDGRHRGRHRHAVRLRQRRHPAAAQRHRPARRRPDPAGQGRHLRRPARLHLAARRDGADQRLQLPGLGDAREAGAGLPRRAPDHRQAGRQTSYVTEAVVREIVESGPPAGGLGAAADRQPGRTARRAHRARTTSASPARRTPPGCSAPTPTCCTAASPSASRPTRSTARSSAPT